MNPVTSVRGHVAIEPHLNDAEQSYLGAFTASRRRRGRRRPGRLALE